MNLDEKCTITYHFLFSGNSLTSSDRSSTVGSHLRPPSVRPTMNQENLDMLEYPFLTMSKYPPGFVQHLGK